MGKCLVIQLQEAVTDTSLLKLNEVRFNFKRTSNDASITQVAFNAWAATKLSIIGSGNFTNAEGSANLGDSLDVKFGENRFYITADVRTLSVENKTYIDQLGLTSSNTHFLSVGTTGNTTLLALSLINDLSDFQYMSFNSVFLHGNTNLTGDISVFVGMQWLTNLSLTNTAVHGSLDSIKSMKLYRLTLSNTRVTGNLSSLSSMTTVSYIDLSRTAITGDIASIKTLVNIAAYASFEHMNIMGNISAFSGMTRTTICPSIKGVSNLTGDIAVLPNNMLFMSNQGGRSQFTWSTKGSRTNIIAMENVYVVSGADQFLIDMATCTLNPVSTAEYYKTIKIYANVTSASASAIATLQSKGVTVTITPF